jgi:hypothetical protein
MAKTYTATVGMNYPTAKGEARVEAGDSFSDLPAKSASWLLDQGCITTGTVAAPTPDAAPVDAPTPDAAPVDAPTPDAAPVDAPAPDAPKGNN